MRPFAITPFLMNHSKSFPLKKGGGQGDSGFKEISTQQTTFPGFSQTF